MNKIQIFDALNHVLSCITYHIISQCIKLNTQLLGLQRRRFFSYLCKHLVPQGLLKLAQVSIWLLGLLNSLGITEFPWDY